VDLAATLAAFADEAAAIDRNEDAARAYVDARRLLLDAGQPALAADLVPRLAAARHLLGDDLATRLALIGTGVSELDGCDPVAASPIRGRLAAANAAAHMLDRRLRDAILLGQVARELAASAGDLVTELNVSATLGSCLVFAGRMDDGWSMLQQTIDRARTDGLEAEAARAYRMAGTSASVLVEYPRAESWLRDGIDFAERVELWNHRHYMAGHLAHVAWATGEWDVARSVAEHALADGRGGITTRITSLYVLGYVAMGRGAWESAAAALDEARVLGEGMRELQRLSPPVWGLAEAALVGGDPAAAIELSEVGYRASVAVDDAAYLFPFLVTGTRARLAGGDPLAAQRWADDVGGVIERVGIPGTLAAVPHARGLLALAAGQTRQARHALEEARSAWSASGRIWEATWAALDLARCASRTNRPADARRLAEEATSIAARLGARPLLDAAAPYLARSGAAGEPESWAPLTAREFEVARLVAEGRTDPEIAAELSLSPRTVGSHVTHILDKLGVGRRTGIAAWVARVESRRPG
jgi:DNA-binding CsgD family transcriptional regulator